MRMLIVLILFVGSQLSSLAQARLTCPDNFHPASKTLCCPVGAVLNRRGQCIYQTKSGCPSGFHAQGKNSCCPTGAILTRDGMCTDYTISSPPSEDDDGGGYSSPPPRQRDTRPPPGVPGFYPQSGNDQCPYAQCSCQSGAQFGNVINNGQACN